MIGCFASTFGERFVPCLLGFSRREDGTVTIFGIMMFVLMLAIGGIAIDVMRYETQRVQLQNTLDRAVLAGAALNQGLDPEAVVNDYFASSGLTDYRLRVDVDQALNYRRVSADAEMDLNTVFMDMFGIRALTSPAYGAAEERVPNIEVSLVLDISGSMRFTDADGMRQIDRLRPAAIDFIETMLEGDMATTTSITIVPYAGHVNPGTTVFDAMGGTRRYITYEDADGNEITALRDHPRSQCPDLVAADFGVTSVPRFNTYPQVPHFMNWTIAASVMDWGWCPLEGDPSAAEASSAITYLSNDVGHLTGFINRMRLHDGTGTQYGMLWGLWMLDPGSDWLVDELIATGEVSTDFDDRPAAYTDPETLKVVVLMTDGNITSQLRPRFDDRTLSPIDAEDEPDIWLNHTRELGNMNDSNDCNGDGCRMTAYGRSTNLTNFYAACENARNNGVVVFTISFNANSSARTEMQNCASSEAHYYRVQGADLSDAFQSIAGAILRLRLVQ